MADTESLAPPEEDAQGSGSRKQASEQECVNGGGDAPSAENGCDAVSHKPHVGKTDDNCIQGGSDAVENSKGLKSGHQDVKDSRGGSENGIGECENGSRDKDTPSPKPAPSPKPVPSPKPAASNSEDGGCMLVPSEQSGSPKTEQSKADDDKMTNVRENDKDEASVDEMEAASKPADTDHIDPSSPTPPSTQLSGGQGEAEGVKMPNGDVSDCSTSEAVTDQAVDKPTEGCEKTDMSGEGPAASHMPSSQTVKDNPAEHSGDSEKVVSETSDNVEDVSMKSEDVEDSKDVIVIDETENSSREVDKDVEKESAVACSSDGNDPKVESAYEENDGKKSNDGSKEDTRGSECTETSNSNPVYVTVSDSDDDTKGSSLVDSLAQKPEADEPLEPDKKTETGGVIEPVGPGECGVPENVPSKPATVDQPLAKPSTDSASDKGIKMIISKPKAKARKSGQPVNQIVPASTTNESSGSSGSGTIKIVNYGNSKITLKLSELEKVLKVKDVGKTLPKTALSGDAAKNIDKDKIGTTKQGDMTAADVSTKPGDLAASKSSGCMETSTAVAQTSTDTSLHTQRHKMRRARFKRKRRTGTYNFPGMKKPPKKKKSFSNTAESDSVDGKSEDGFSDFEPLRKVQKKTIGSPRKHCNALDLLTRNSHRAFIKRRTVLRRKSGESALKGKTVMDFLRERQDQGSAAGNGQNSAVVTKDGLIPSLKSTNAEDSENLAGQRKRKLTEEGVPVLVDGSLDDLAKKRRVTEGDDKSKPPTLQPMVMLVTNHLPNSPGLRSILPKVGASPLAPGTTGQVVISGGQQIFVPAQPLLLQPGSKVSLVPTTVTKSGVSFIATTVAQTKTQSTGTGRVSSPPVLIEYRSNTSQQGSASSSKGGTESLRSLLSKSGTMTGLKTMPVGMLPTLVPAQVIPISSPASLLSSSTVTSNTATVMTVSHGNIVSSTSFSTSTSSAAASSISSASAIAARLMASAEAKAAASLLNGLSMPVTPPKTPEGEAMADGSAGASAGVRQDKGLLPLCCCKISGANFTKLSSGATYCQALDSVDGKALGCCNKVTNTQLVRPGVKIPFMLVCEVHRRRLKLHQCCPGCGHFCTEGKFYQCQREGGHSVHNFHKQCQTERGGKLYCPHCGEESTQTEVTLTLNDARPKQSNEQIRANLRKSIAKARMVLGGSSLSKKKPEVPPGVSVILPNSKTISTDGLPVGPERDHLERLMNLCNHKAERPKKYRVLPKHMYPPACEGDIEKVFYMLMDGVDPNEPYAEEDNQTPLHGATYSGIFGMVYLLVQAGAILHTPDKNLKTPLMCAAEYGYLNIIKYLVAAGARLDDRGEDRMTCLHYAAKAGHMDIIQYILDIDALDVNVTDEGGWTPIMWATESQLVDVVRYLVSRGGDPNKKDNEENNGLHWAAFAGSLDITELFLDMGCEVDSPNEHGDRPLHIAARQNHYEVVVILLARGANVDVFNLKGETPESCCSEANSPVSMALKVNKQLRSFAAKLKRPERLIHRDISLGRERNPIACVNDVDNEQYPTDYLYVDHNVETQDLHINNVITSLQSCRCKDDCSSLYCVCARSSVKCWYDKFGRLLEDFNLLDPPHIFECNRACRCWVNCNNRVVQNGITCRLQMFRTNGRGWGMRSLMDIPKGTFICEYIGELISDSEADRREDDSYLFDLDNKDGDTYCIDARKYGNVARFINHLCEPNIVPVKVFVEHQDLRFPRICFFSSREIKAYEELGFDYGEKFWIIKWKQFTCNCGSPKCRYSVETIKKTLEEYRLRHEDEDISQDT